MQVRIQIQHLLKLNIVQSVSKTDKIINSNTTLVKVKFKDASGNFLGLQHSNTTLVKVK